MEIRFLLPVLILLAPASVRAEVVAPDAVALYHRKVKGKTMAERLDRASLAFLGIPFLDAPLGEGPSGEFDQGPMVRFDGFDCTTFVETVVALAGARQAQDFETRLRSLRYANGEVAFEKRNHFPCIDWIPNNARAGFITDITVQVATLRGWPTHTVTTPVNKRGWYRKLPETVLRVTGLNEAQRASRLAKLHALGDKLAPQAPSLPFVSLDDILVRKPVPEAEVARRKQEEEQLAATRRAEARQPQSSDDDLEKTIHDELIDKRLRYLIQDVEVDAAFLEAIPSGTILNVVRPGWKIPGTTLNVSHQGFVIRKKAGVFFRHVSKSGGRAKDVPLANYLRLCLLLPAIKGINLLAVNE